MCPSREPTQEENKDRLFIITNSNGYHQFPMPIILTRSLSAPASRSASRRPPDEGRHEKWRSSNANCSAGTCVNTGCIPTKSVGRERLCRADGATRGGIRRRHRRRSQRRHEGRPRPARTRSPAHRAPASKTGSGICRTCTVLQGPCPLRNPRARFGAGADLLSADRVLHQRGRAAPSSRPYPAATSVSYLTNIIHGSTWIRCPSIS